jgi:probable addiction module antidote protein
MNAMALKTVPYDSAQHLATPKAMSAYLSEAFAEGDPKAITHALGVIARARGMSKLARESGVAREALYKALSQEGNPEFSTIVKVVNAMGLELAVKAASPAQAKIATRKPSRGARRVGAVKLKRRRAATKRSLAGV